VRQWRLIYDYPATGTENMAKDESILAEVGSGQSPPTIRLYHWSPPCLSLGYAQKTDDIDIQRLTNFGWDMVRRLTGGRAVLHMDELTYSVTLPIHDPLASGNVIESYRRISQGLIAGLKILGIETQANPQEKRQGPHSAVCFETPSHYEITVNGRKLIGSAQARRKDAILQHGSLPLSGDIARICEVLKYPDENSRELAKMQVRSRATTLAEAMGGKLIEWRTAAEAMIKGFEQVFDLEFSSIENDVNN
jgi:lipoyl(octanoyl) transferase